jgi:two-component system sensor histidine kinase FlrB
MSALPAPSDRQAYGSRVRELEQAFAEFNATSALLQNAYRELEQRATLLSAELAEARSERLLQLAEKERIADRLQRLLEALPGGVIVLDGQGVIREHNPGAVELLDQPLLDCDWREVLGRAVVRASESELELADGRVASIALRALQADAGCILLLSDVTEQRRLQALADRNARLSQMGEMSARLAHQTRTPLTAAVLYSSQLARAGAEPERVQRYAQKILAQLRLLERMVNDMLCFARGATAGDEDLDLGVLFDELLQTLTPQLGARASVRALPVPANLTVRGSREALGGALLNLLDNALRAAGDDARVELEARAEHDGVSLLVHDNGPGVPDGLRERIFEPFFTTRSNGTGLGLAVVQSVARAHGGTARVEARVGGGTSFGLYLPRVSEALLPSGQESRLEAALTLEATAREPASRGRR